MDDSSFNLGNPNPDSSNLDQQAISAALENNWELAIKLNKQIITHEPNNIDCLNRLARAMFELGNLSEAKKNCQKVLEIDPYNNIAQKNLKRIGAVKKDHFKNHHSTINQIVSADFFLEESGITKVVSLIKLAEPTRLSKLYPGMMVNLVTKKKGIVVTDMEENYLGVFADDISYKLLRLIKGGNKYSALIKSIKPNSLVILVRETFRARRFRNQPSFLDSSQATTYSSDNISLSFNEPDIEVSETEDQTG